MKIWYKVHRPNNNKVAIKVIVVYSLIVKIRKIMLCLLVIISNCNKIVIKAYKMSNIYNNYNNNYITVIVIGVVIIKSKINYKTRKGISLVSRTKVYNKIFNKMRCKTIYNKISTYNKIFLD
jgi:hypothetical protein